MNKESRIKQYKNFIGDYGYFSAEVLDYLGFFTAPASIKYHGAYDGGLFDHSFITAKILVELTERLDLKWERPESPYIVGMYRTKASLQRNGQKAFREGLCEAFACGSGSYDAEKAG